MIPHADREVIEEAMDAKEREEMKLKPGDVVINQYGAILVICRDMGDGDWLLECRDGYTYNPNFRLTKIGEL